MMQQYTYRTVPYNTATIINNFHTLRPHISKTRDVSFAFASNCRSMLSCLHGAAFPEPTHFNPIHSADGDGDLHMARAQPLVAVQ